MTKPLHSVGISCCAFACLTWLLPSHVIAAEVQGTKPPVPAVRPVVRDIALGSNGSMSGQLVDVQGRGRANQIVVIKRQGGDPVKTQTDKDGRFNLSGLSGGTYQIATLDSAAVCRCWSEKTAPPAARKELLLVSGEGIERGQYPFSDMLFSAPVLIALVIAAAIAIPIAVHNSQDDAS